MSDINWAGLVQRTNPFGEFADGMARGTEMRRDRERENLFMQKQAFEIQQAKRAQAKEDRALSLDNENRLERGILGHMASTNPRAAQAKAVQVGQTDMAEQFGKLDESQRKQAAERAGVLAAYVDSLSQPQEGQPPPTPQSIKAQIMQDADALTELGFTQEQLQAFEPTPASLAKLRAEALGQKGVLEQTNKERDDKRAAAQAAEVARHNKVVEGQGGARLGLARDANARGWAAHRQRVKSKGYGTPGAGVIPDGDVEIDP